MIGSLEQGGPVGFCPESKTTLWAGDHHMAAEPPWPRAAISYSVPSFDLAAFFFLNPFIKYGICMFSPGDS